MQNVARNTESCQKVTEQLVESPSLASRKQRQRENKASVREHFDILIRETIFLKVGGLWYL